MSVDVTPCVGVWIEMEDLCGHRRAGLVTPCVGVWIEIWIEVTIAGTNKVTPCVGVWIEIKSTIQTPPA